MSTLDKQPEAQDPSALSARILEALKGIRYGNVEITVHDGKVVQIDRREKFRVQPAGADRQD
jgi:hypothetical protein